MISNDSILEQLQVLVHNAGLDGWLFYDFRGLNPFPAQLLKLNEGILTRRWFLYLPASGQPTLVHHRIESTTWQQLLQDQTVAFKDFASHEPMDAQLRATLRGAKRIAMEFSPFGEVPYVGFVDAGTVQRINTALA